MGGRGLSVAGWWRTVNLVTAKWPTHAEHSHASSSSHGRCTENLGTAQSPGAWAGAPGPGPPGGKPSTWLPPRGQFY